MRVSLFCLLMFLLARLASAAEPETPENLYAQKRYPEAETAFRARLVAKPDDAEAHHFLGRLALGRQQVEESLPYLERAVQLAPDNAEYQFYHGSACLQQAGKLGMSFKALGLAKRGRTGMERAVQIDPGSILYRQALIEFYTQAPGIVGGGIDKAYAQVEALRPLDSRAAAFAFSNLRFREKKYAEAIASIEPLLAANPDDYQALYFLGRVAAAEGLHLDRGIAALRRCLELPVPPRLAGHAAVNFRLGEALLKQGNQAAARAAFQASLAVDPNYASARTALDRLGPG